MSTQVVSRKTEVCAIADFLASVVTEPGALVMEGEPGIGKTTLWLAAVEQARVRGFQVLAARPAATESALAYTSLADMLNGVDPAALTDLPAPQRVAVDQVLLRVDADHTPTDQRAVAAAFLSVVGGLADQARVLVAIDDLQWLDPSSRLVVAFAARRLSGPVGVLATIRTRVSGSAGSWLQLPRPDAVRWLAVPPLTLGALHAVICERLGRSFSRPTMVRIQQMSGGNPFYALELARAVSDGQPTKDASLPDTLTELVRSTIRSQDPDVDDALLAAACLAAPTVDLVTGAVGADRPSVVALLEQAEDTGIIEIDGDRVRFSHPIFARGVYDDAAPLRRRAMHRRLAGVVEEPELQARHLALGSTGADPLTLRSLDAAAESARSRGAPAAAAELIDLAIGLGGDTPQRRIRSANHHFNAGDSGRARALLEETLAQLPAGLLRAEAAHLLGYVRLLDDSFPEAAELLEHSLAEAVDHPAVLVPMLVTLSFAWVNAGRLDAATQRAEEAVANAERFGAPDSLSQSLSMRTVLRLMRGHGVDEPSLRRALELEGRQATTPITFRASVHNAMLLAWTGRLDEAHEEMTSIRRHCIERGEDAELAFVAFHGALTEIWRGNFADAELIVEDAVERAQQRGDDMPLSVALTNRALLAAYAGRVDQARGDVSAAHAAARRCGSDRLGEWPTTTLGFLEVSLGHYDAALATFKPLLAKLDAAPDATEIIAASFVPDAVEAMVGLDRVDSAEPLVAALEANGRRLDRPWMLAVGARGRAMLSAARGDIKDAVEAAEDAMGHHERLPMPFEQARTQLLLGQLQRRQRRNEAAAATLHSALDTFERLGTPLWANRARADLGRANIGPHGTAALTPSEQRVAELAASGMTNRNVAAALFISPKTVEANLARVYAKLGIHSRAELGGHMSEPEG